MRLTTKWKKSIQTLTKQGLGNVIETEFKLLNSSHHGSTNITSKEEKSFKHLQTIATSDSKRQIRPMLNNSSSNTDTVTIQKASQLHSPRLYLMKLLNNEPNKPDTKEPLPLLLTDISPDRKPHGVLKKSLLKKKETRNNGLLIQSSPNEAKTFWRTNANSVIMNTEANTNSNTYGDSDDKKICYNYKTINYPSNNNLTLNINKNEEHHSPSFKHWTTQYISDTTLPISSMPHTVSNKVKKSIKFIESPIDLAPMNCLHSKSINKNNFHDKKSIIKTTPKKQSPSKSDSDLSRSHLDSNSDTYDIELTYPYRNNLPKKTTTTIQSTTTPIPKQETSLKTIIKTKRNSITHQDDQKFFDLLLNANTLTQHDKSISKPSTNFRNLNNQLLHLKVKLPKVKKEQIPIFTNNKNLNNYLIREFTTGETKELVIKREKVVHDAQIAITQLEAEQRAQERRNNEFDRKFTKQFTKKATKKFINQLSTKIYEDELLAETTRTEGESKGMRMSKAIVKLNEIEYEDISKQPLDTISRKNLKHVQQLIKINKGTMDKVDYGSFGFSSVKKVKEEIGDCNYKAVLTLSKLGPAPYVKKTFRPITIEKFHSANGHYF